MEKLELSRWPTQLAHADELITFLTNALHDVASAGPLATEHRNSKMCQTIVTEILILHWCDSNAGDHVYIDDATQKKSELYGLATRDKNGQDNENIFYLWCRRCMQIREECSTATEHTRATDELEERHMFKVLDHRMLEDDLGHTSGKTKSMLCYTPTPEHLG